MSTVFFGTFVVIVHFELSCPLITPCAYPKLTDENFEEDCSISYHKFPYICDPLKIITRKGALLINEAISSIFDSCISEDIVTYEARNYRIAIAIIANASMGYNEKSPQVRAMRDSWFLKKSESGDYWWRT